MQPDQLAIQIDALLPQTQCRKCGFQGCLPYATAISQHQADINQCPPGGEQGIAQLAALLGVPTKPLNPVFGANHPRQTAIINEAECIGCSKCLPPCPVDAILGSAKQMHTIISHQCTGCELCIAPCPTNCITMSTSLLPAWNKTDAWQARLQYQAKNERLTRQNTEKTERLNQQKQQLATFKLTTHDN